MSSGSFSVGMEFYYGSKSQAKYGSLKEDVLYSGFIGPDIYVTDINFKAMQYIQTYHAPAPVSKQVFIPDLKSGTPALVEIPAPKNSI